jgi:hypothetical protein
MQTDWVNTSRARRQTGSVDGGVNGCIIPDYNILKLAAYACMYAYVLPL